MTSSLVPSSTYKYDDVELSEDLSSWDSSDNINDIISPNNTWQDNTVDFGHDSFYAQLGATASNFGQVYKDFGKPGSSLLEYNAGFFWLRLPKPDQDEHYRIQTPRFTYEGPYRLPHQIRQALRGRCTDDALLMSCIAIGDAAEYSSNATSGIFPGEAAHQMRTSLLHEFLLRVLLVTAGADTMSLSSVHESEVFKAYPKMLDPTDAHMPLPNTNLPSKRSKLREARIPRFFEVSWPIESPVAQSGGLPGFFHDFYHMTVRRPYQSGPKFNFIRVLVNPEGVTSKLSQPKCLIVCSSRYPQERLFQALLSVRVKQAVRMWSPPHSWIPLHELMDCISIIYQVMFQETQLFIETRLLLLQKMKFHGRVHPHRSKFQYLHHLEDQVEKSRNALNSAHEDLEAWMSAEIHGVTLASIPNAEWPARMERLLTDAAHLVSCLDDLTDRRIKLHSMLKEQLDLNSGTRSLILTILASIYVPLAFVSSYFGMNATEITDGGLISTTTFWEVSIPLVVASVIIPVAFSGLLIRMTIRVVRSSYRKWLEWKPLVTVSILIAFNVASAIVGGRPLFWIVWALNLLYTLKFIMWIPAIYRDLLFASQRLRDAKAARKSYTSRDPSTASVSNSAVELDVARDSNASRDSGETESSWVTANIGVTDGSGETEGSWGTANAGSSSANSSDLYQNCTREVLRKTHWQRRIQASAVFAQAAMALGGLGLGAAFLTLDIIYPKAKGLSLYHSFALWMSLVSVIDFIGVIGSRQVLYKLMYYFERRQERNAAAKRRHQDSHAGHSERSISVSRNGVV